MAQVSTTSRRGFTLLELILAITVLATLMALIAAAWRNAGDWTRESEAQRRALLLPRVTDVVRSQWAERRTSLDLDKPGSSIHVGPARIEFVTSLPVLDRSLPLVVASYIIESDDSVGAPAGTYRLMYKEQGIIDTGAAQRSEGAEAQRAGASSASGGPRVPGLEAPAPRTTVLLGRCTELALEWFDNGDEARREAAKRAEEQSKQQESASQGGGLFDEASGLAEDAAPVEKLAPPAMEWKGIEKVPERLPLAVRIRGVHQGEPFSCLMVIGRSR